MITRITLALLLCSIALLAGCFETPFSLGTEADAKTDTALCGNWEVGSKDSPDKPKAKMFIRNLDGKHYLVEWINPPEEGGKPEDVEPLLISVWVGKVNNVSFAHARNLLEDGAIAEKHLVIRFTFDKGQITLRSLNEKFFNDKTLVNDADFRQIVEENLENPDMYDHDEMVATRVAK